MTYAMEAAEVGFQRACKAGHLQPDSNTLEIMFVLGCAYATAAELTDTRVNGAFGRKHPPAAEYVRKNFVKLTIGRLKGAKWHTLILALGGAAPKPGNLMAIRRSYERRMRALLRQQMESPMPENSDDDADKIPLHPIARRIAEAIAAEDPKERAQLREDLLMVVLGLHDDADLYAALRAAAQPQEWRRKPPKQQWTPSPREHYSDGGVF